MNIYHGIYAMIAVLLMIVVVLVGIAIYTGAEPWGPVHVAPYLVR